MKKCLIYLCVAVSSVAFAGKAFEVLWSPRESFKFADVSPQWTARSEKVYKMLTGAGPVGSHRGGQRCWPENTLTAFKETNKRWPKMLLETDVMMTSDGELVLSHDMMVTRVSEGKGTIAGQTLEQLKQYDFGYKFRDPGQNDFPWRGKGVKICTLEEALKALPDTVFEIEIKGGTALAKETIKVIRKCKASDRVILASFHPLVPPAIKKMAPEMMRCYGMMSGMSLLKKIRSDDWEKYQPDFDVLSLTEQFFRLYKVSKQDIERMHKRGIWLQIHTVDRPQLMKKYLDMGFDSVLSDRPDLLMNALEIKKTGNGQ